jgi:recombination associated protein RdgC
MWFKNFYIYKFTKPVDALMAGLSETLGKMPLMPCSGLAPQSLGWVSPVKLADAPMAIEQGPFHWIRLGREERLLPASVVRETLEERVQAISEETGHPVSSKRKKDMREAIIAELMPRAFTRRQYTDVLIDRERGLLLVATGTDKRADECTSLLRETLGELPVRKVEPKSPVTDRLTQWIHAPACLPAGWTLEDHCELRSADSDPAVLGLRKMSINKDDLKSWLDSKFRVSKLRINWRDEVSLTLDNQARLKGMRHLELMKERLADRQQDDPLLEARTLLTLLGPVWSGLCQDVIDALQTGSDASRDSGATQPHDQPVAQPA